MVSQWLLGEQLLGSAWTALGLGRDLVSLGLWLHCHCLELPGI